MKRLTFGANALLAFLALIVLTACGGGPASLEEPGGVVEPSSGPAASAAAQEPGPEGAGQVRVETQRFLTQEYQRKGQAAFDLGDYEEARKQLVTALEIDPSNPEARALLGRVSALLGDRPADADQVQKRFTDEAKARVEETRMRVEDLLIRSDAALVEKRYDEAIQRCDDALLVIRYNPFMIQGDQLEQTVRAKKEGLLIAIEEGRKRDAETLAARAAAARDVREREQAERKVYRVRRLFEQANIAFASQRYDDCAKHLDLLLQVDPGNEAARELIDVARNASYEGDRRATERRWKQEWARTFDDLVHSDLPQTDFIKHDRAHWRDIVNNRKPIETLHTEADVDSVEDRAVLDKLDNTLVEPNFAEAELDSWVGYFRQVTELNFLVSNAVRELDMEQTTLKNVAIPRMSAKKALDLITQFTPVRWRVANGIVHLVTAEESLGRIYTQFYEVRDLVANLQNFVAPEIYIAPSGADMEQPEAPDPEPVVIDQERLLDLIRGNIGIPMAFEMPGASINMHANGVFIARTTREVHERVKKLLTDLRINIGIQVNVEARFLRVEDKFLEEIGVDFRGLGDDASRGEPGKGLTRKRNRSSARFDDYGTGITPTTPGEVGSGTEPGIFFDDGNDGDIMARTEHLFDLSLGNARDGMTNAGGLALQYTFLDDTEIEAILLAVSKRERVEQINAPNLLLSNTQRAHLTVTHQVSYVRDFDVEIAQAAAVANPVVSMVSDGIVLDVHPVVSADRRFITMELRPTLAQLEQPIPTYTTTLGVGQEITIQLPHLQVQRIRTTVTIPDGGTLMLGGMKMANKQDYNSGIPILKDLPLISFLFSKRGTYTSNKKIVILLKGTIVIAEELEPPLIDQED